MDPLSLYEREDDVESESVFEPTSNRAGISLLFASDDDDDDSDAEQRRAEEQKRQMEEESKRRLQRYFRARGAIPFGGKESRVLAPALRNDHVATFPDQPVSAAKEMIDTLLDDEFGEGEGRRPPVRSGGAGTVAVDLLAARPVALGPFHRVAAAPARSPHAGGGSASARKGSRKKHHLDGHVHSSASKGTGRKGHRHSSRRVGDEATAATRANTVPTSTEQVALSTFTFPVDADPAQQLTEATSSNSESDGSHPGTTSTHSFDANSSSGSSAYGDARGSHDDQAAPVEIPVDELVLRDGGVPPLRAHLFYEENNGEFVDRARHGAIMEYYEDLEAQRAAAEEQQQRRAKKWAFFYPSYHRKKHDGDVLDGVEEEGGANLHTNAPHYARYARNTLLYSERINVFLSAFACGSAVLALIAVTLVSSAENATQFSNLALFVSIVFPFHVGFHLFVCLFPIITSLASIGWGFARWQAARRKKIAAGRKAAKMMAARAAESGLGAKRARSRSSDAVGGALPPTSALAHPETQGAFAVMRKRRQTFQAKTRLETQKEKNMLRKRRTLEGGQTTGHSSPGEEHATAFSATKHVGFTENAATSAGQSSVAAAEAGAPPSVTGVAAAPSALHKTRKSVAQRLHVTFAGWPRRSTAAQQSAAPNAPVARLHTNDYTLAVSTARQMNYLAFRQIAAQHMESQAAQQPARRDEPHRSTLATANLRGASTSENLLSADYAGNARTMSMAGAAYGGMEMPSVGSVNSSTVGGMGPLPRRSTTVFHPGAFNSRRSQSPFPGATVTSNSSSSHLPFSPTHRASHSHVGAQKSAVAAAPAVAPSARGPYGYADPDGVLTGSLAANNFIANSFTSLQLWLSRKIFRSSSASYLRVLLRPRLYCLLGTVALTFLELSCFDQRSASEVFVEVATHTGNVYTLLMTVYAGRAALLILVWALDVFF